MDSDLEISELERRKLWARRTRYAIWFVPLVLLLLVPTIIADRLTVATVAAVLLISAGAVVFYLTGTRWERHWADLIRKRSASVHEAPPN